MGIKRCQVHQYATLSDNTFTAFFHDQMLLLIVYQTWLLMITDPWDSTPWDFLHFSLLNPHQEITISIISVLLSSQNQKYCSQCQITSLGFFLLFPFFFVPVSSQNHQFFARITTFFRVVHVFVVYLHTQFLCIVSLNLRQVASNENRLFCLFTWIPNRVDLSIHFCYEISTFILLPKKVKLKISRRK